MKTCCKCKIGQSLEAFGKDKSRKDGITAACKKCRNKNTYAWNRANPEKVRQANLSNKSKRKLYYSNSERALKYREMDIKRKFGISQEEYEQILVKQNGVCAICKKFRLNKGKKYMAIDHCHKTGKVRGVLCHFCNRGLGLFDDNQDLLTQAIGYLARK